MGDGTAEGDVGDGDSKIKLGELQPWERGGTGPYFSIFRKLVSGSLWGITQRDKAAQGSGYFLRCCHPLKDERTRW